MLDCQVASLENAIARYMATGRRPGPLGAHHPSIAPFGAFRAADGWLVIAAGNDAFVPPARATCSIVRTSPTTKVRRQPDAHRSPRRAAGRAGGGARVDRTGRPWLARLEAADIPCGPINDIAQVLADPQVRARNMVVTVDDDRLDGFAVAGNPIKLSAFPDATQRGPVPDLRCVTA